MRRAGAVVGLLAEKLGWRPTCDFILNVGSIV
jgi:hypothetical protein